MDIPRDIELRIFKFCDIDTRRKLGLRPCKLKIPKHIVECIEKVFEKFHGVHIRHPETDKIIMTFIKASLGDSVANNGNVYYKYMLFSYISDNCLTENIMQKLDGENDYENIYLHHHAINALLKLPESSN